jgi:deoxyribodipyrimidine photo-lyase
VEPEIGAGKNLLATLAKEACVVVGDDFPSFMLPHMLEAAARQMTVRFELVDSNGLLPLRAAPKEFLSAFDFRRFLQRALPAHLDNYPELDPLAGQKLPRLASLPKGLDHWRRPSPELLQAQPAALARLPIDHAVGPAILRGGAEVGSERLRTFVGTKLAHYPERRNDPRLDGSSRLSPYLHFGHLSVHEVLAAIGQNEGWSPKRLTGISSGAKAGWWGMSPAAESFLDEVVTWRELGYNLCVQRPDDHGRYEALPEWARRTLDEHANDPRPHLYSLAQLEAGRTHDAVWNAAHGQLVRDGWFHNRMRMLWGKKILEWSAHPRDALKAMTVLMNKYSLDGRNPNSYTGYLWTLGRYDRPWGPERPIFGKVRYMSSEQSARKTNLNEYVERYGPT